jgi:hypothetical protein
MMRWIIRAIVIPIALVAQATQAQVLISEFLADPQAPLESEWLELYNIADTAVDLSDWTLCDSVRCGIIDSIQIEPGQYLILSQNPEDFLLFYSGFDGMPVGVSGWRFLNNTGDMILLLDNEEGMVDSVLYNSGNGDNISWERISYDNPGWEMDNWHSSLDLSGSTPGRANSHPGEFPSGFAISLPDKLFSPGCDCPDDMLAIDISLPEECTITLMVYSLEGRRLNVLYDDRALVSGRHYYDGKDSSGRYLDVGMYILLAKLSGNCSGVAKLVFGVAK